jgi:hypothetical protein
LGLGEIMPRPERAPREHFRFNDLIEQGVQEVAANATRKIAQAM